VKIALLATALLGAVAAATGAVSADTRSPAVEGRRQPPASPSAEAEYNRGVRARIARDWPAATDAFRRALSFDRGYADAWNELGYALRHQGRYDESLQAYTEALRLRPEFPEALEYLGEAYVEMGRLDDARRVLTRLRALDTARANELAEVIDRRK
jgi:tetratricopeptide (TPR) repeat protein